VEGVSNATNTPRFGALSDLPAAAVFALALALRLAWVIFVQVHQPGDAYYIQGDAYEYTAVARNLVEGRGWWSPDLGGSPYVNSPLFPLFVAGFFAFGLSLFWVTVAQALIGAATCWGVVRLGRRMMSPAGAVAAGLVMAVYPYYFHYAGHILTETLSILFGLLVFAALVVFSRDPSPRRAAVVGIALGLATLNHPETYAVPPLFLAWALLFHPQRALVAKRLFIAFVVMGLTILPWHAYHAVKNGKNILLPPSLHAGGILVQGTLVAKGRITRDPAFGKNAAGLGIEGHALEQQRGQMGSVKVALGRVLGDVEKDPSGYLWIVAMKFRRMWGLAPEMGTYARIWITIPTGLLNFAVYLGCVVGLILHRRREEAWLAVAIVAMVTLPHLVFYAQPRYRLPAMPMVILFAGVAFGAACDRLAARHRPAGDLLAKDQGRWG